MITFFIGSIEALRRELRDRRIPASDVMRGQHPTFRYLGMEPDRICGPCPEPGDEVIVDEHSLRQLGGDQADVVRAFARLLVIRRDLA